MEIYLVRHGQTDWNVEKKLQGNIDIPLNEVGRRMAVETGEAMKQIPFDRIYCSPLKRALETAEKIRGGRDVELVINESLRELGFGVDEGRLYDEIVADPDSKFRYFFTEPEKYGPALGGETLEHICERAAAFLENEIMPLESSMQRIMIVAHGAMNKALMMRIRDCKDMAQFWQGGLQQNGTAEVIRLESGCFYYKE